MIQHRHLSRAKEQDDIGARAFAQVIAISKATDATAVVSDAPGCMPADYQIRCAGTRVLRYMDWYYPADRVAGFVLGSSKCESGSKTVAAANGKDWVLPQCD